MSPTISRRTVLTASAVGAAGVLAGPAATLAHADDVQLTLVSPTGAHARVITAASASLEITDTAQTLVDHIALATGTVLARGTELAEDPTLIDIVIGQHPDLPTPDFDGLDAEGFIIDASSSLLTIHGPTDPGTRFGVYDFLEQHLGITWLLPTDLGRDVPELTTLTVPYGRRVEEPVFRGRAFWPLAETLDADSQNWRSSNVETVWASYNRLRNRTAMPGNHTLYRIFAPSVYANPELPTFEPGYYPTINGTLRLPTGSSGWQPYLGTQLTVDRAVEFVIAWFDEKPSRLIVSVGINDGGGSFDDRDLDPDLINSVGQPSASAAFYGWLNQVVTTVLQQRPDLSDRRVMTIAYNNVVDPPEFDLHPNIVPLVVRGTWTTASPASRAEQRAKLAAWSERATEIGLYDYLFGDPVLVPRISLTTFADMYRFAADLGARYVWAEYPPNWAETAKGWVCAKLLWDPHADVDALIEQWCVACVGPTAAPHLVAYVNAWDTFWSSTIAPTAWLHNAASGSGVGYDPADYLAHIPRELTTLAQELLDRCVQLAQTPQQRERAELLRRTYDLPHAAVSGYPKPTEPLTTRTGVRLVRDLGRTIDNTVAAAAAIPGIIADYRTDPLAMWREPGHGSTFSGFSGDAFWELTDQLNGSSHDVIRGRLQAMADDATSVQAARFASLILAAADGDVPQQFADASFDLVSDTPWSLESAVPVENPAARTGARCIQVRAKDSRVLQTVNCSGGLFAARAWFRCAGPKPEAGVVSVGFYLMSETGAILRRLSQPLRFLNGDDQWQWVGICEDIPSSWDGTPVAKVQLFVSVLNHGGTAPVFIDDAEGYLV